MTRFAHIADLHLGFNQYLLLQRHLDFLNVFTESVKLIIDQKPDFVLISGDVFHVKYPDWESKKIFSLGVKSFRNHGIKLYGSTGNHCHTMYSSWLEYYNLDNYKPTTMTSYNNFIDIYKINWSMDMVDRAKEIVVNKEKFNILLLHHGIERFFGKITPDDAKILEGNFDYVALGHIHIPYVDGKLFNPGSLEYTSSGDWGKPQGGWFIVDVKDDKSIEYHHYQSKHRPSTEVIFNAVDYKQLYDTNVYSKLFKPDEMYNLVLTNCELSPKEINSLEKHLNRATGSLRIKIISETKKRQYEEKEMANQTNIYEHVFGELSNKAKLVIESSNNTERVIELL